MSSPIQNKHHVKTLCSTLYIYKIVNGVKQDVEFKGSTKFTCLFKHKEEYKNYLISLLRLNNIDFTGIDSITSVDY